MGICESFAEWRSRDDGRWTSRIYYPGTKIVKYETHSWPFNPLATKFLMRYDSDGREHDLQVGGYDNDQRLEYAWHGRQATVMDLAGLINRCSVFNLNYNNDIGILIVLYATIVELPYPFAHSVLPAPLPRIATHLCSDCMRHRPGLCMAHSGLARWCSFSEAGASANFLS
jgi:hypothetical protein